MNQFDSYRPEAWQDDGLTVRAPVHVLMPQTASKRNKKWMVTLTATVVSFGAAAAFNFSFPAAAVKASNFLMVTAVGGGRYTADSDVPVGYWPRLVTVLRNAPVLPDDSSVSDPDPIV
jgi:hypothetical protein